MKAVSLIFNEIWSLTELSVIYIISGERGHPLISNLMSPSFIRTSDEGLKQ